MSILNIDHGQAEVIGNQIRHQTTLLYNLRAQFQALNYQVDAQILARRNIDQRMRRICQDLLQFEDRLNQLNSFVQQSVQRYRDTETQLVRRASDIGTGSDVQRASKQLYAVSNRQQQSELNRQRQSELTRQQLKQWVQMFVKLTIDKIHESNQIMKDLNWKYVGANVEESVQTLVEAEFQMGSWAKGKRDPEAFQIVKNAMHNHSLKLTDEQLKTLMQIDPYGAKDYIRRQEQESKEKRNYLFEFVDFSVFERAWDAVKDQAKSDWEAFKQINSSWDTALSYWSAGLLDPFITSYYAPITSKEYWLAQAEIVLDSALAAMGGTFARRSLSPLLDDVISGVGNVIRKGTGKITGSLNGLTDAEKRVVNDLTARGKNVEIIPKDPNAKVKTPDFKVDGVRTELKTLENPNVNTGITRLQQGLKQGAETVIIDARNAGLTSDQARQIINRASGTYPNKTIPGKVEIWTNEGTITYP